MKDYIKLLRIKHYLKNILIFLPLIFSQKMLNIKLILLNFGGFLAFSCIASAIYIINDIGDIEKDRLHPVKKNRPLASGRISVTKAWILSVILIVLSAILNFIVCKNSFYPIIWLFLYLFLNILYTYYLKEIPIIDCLILSSGFVIRVLYGASIVGIEVSSFLYLTILFGAFYVVLGKRRNEIMKHGDSSRNVLKYYSKEFLDKNMYVFFALTIAFYSLWCINYDTINRMNGKLLLFSIPIIIYILMRYSYNIEKDSEGDPVDVILSDKNLLICSVIFVIYMCLTLYWN